MPMGIRAPARPAVPPGAPVSEYHPRTPAAAPRRWWPPLWTVLIAGYSTFGRSFAYLGVKPLFIGEIYLAVAIFRNQGKWINRFIDGLLRLHLLPLGITLTVLWGLFEVARPVLAGASIRDCLRTCAFNYYPLYIPVGIAIGRRLSLDGFIRFWKGYTVYYVIYALVYALWGKAADPVAPWNSSVGLFQPPTLGPFVPVGFFALWELLRHWNWRWVIMPLSLAPLLFETGRGSMLGFIAGIMLVAASSVRRFMLVSGVMGVLLALLLIVGPYIKGGDEGRSETLDPTISFARLIATFDDDAAYRMLLRRGYYGAAEDMYNAKGTAGWRSTIWLNAINSLHNTWLMALGQGHGKSIVDLTPDGAEIHTPHNFVIYAIYYTGAIGLFLFMFMLGALLLASWRIPQPNIRTLQVAHIAVMTVVAAVGNMFETPIAAIPFYLISGVCIGLPLTRTGGTHA